jgi:DNA mismatch repair protein MutL
VRIRTLPAHVANQIAAGEVIERPASVVKELLENALDAGARSIHVAVGFGGLNQINVSDDGRGMVADDLPLAIAPHATSKLHVLDDLYAIQSMGFRGEALASMASVARVFIQSRAEGCPDAMGLEHDEHGTRLVPCARNQGTTIEVRDLFFNAPVRKKFLKSERQEYQAIEAVLKRVAFSESSVAFTLSHNGHLRLTLPRAPCEQSKRARLTKLLGKAFVDEAVCLDVTRGQMRLHGWTSGLAYGRSQQDKIWFYINQRMVRDKLVLHALKQAYASTLPTGRYPACVLFLTLPLDDVDVNVHPTKHEVRFCDARGVHDFIRSALTDCLVLSRNEAVVTPGASRVEAASYSQGETHVALTRAAEPARTAWLVLHATCAILTHHKHAYLIDVERLNQQMQEALFRQEGTPKAARPLLVPVTITLPKDGCRVIERCRDALQNLGLVCDDVVSDEAADAVYVRMIPCALPNLNLHNFFKALCKHDIQDEEALMLCLIKASPINLMAMHVDEHMALVAYWEEEFTRGAHLNMSVCLDRAGCQKVFEHA